MDIKTGLAIYNSMWLMEPQSALSCLQMWEQYNQGGTKFNPQNIDNTNASFELHGIQNEAIKYAPVDVYEARSFTGFDGADIAIIPIDGVIMKNDFCGYFGTATMLSFFQLAEKTPSLKQIILLIDSPGGTVDGTAQFANAVAASDKPTKTVLHGLMCSAALWIGTAADEVIATSNTDIIGSIGTMMQWYDRSKYLESNGFILREFNATKSADKNKAFNEANKGDGRLLVQSLLNPTNDEFIAAVKQNRAGKFDTKQEDIFTGKTYVAKDALKFGLIDKIEPMEQALKLSALPGTTSVKIPQQELNVSDPGKPLYSHAKNPWDPKTNLFEYRADDRINGIEESDEYYLELQYGKPDNNSNDAAEMPFQKELLKKIG